MTECIFVGLDVHKDSIDVAIAAEERDGEVRHYGRIGGDIASLDKVIRRLQSRGVTLHVVYECPLFHGKGTSGTWRKELRLT